MQGHLEAIRAAELEGHRVPLFQAEVSRRPVADLKSDVQLFVTSNQVGEHKSCCRCGRRRGDVLRPRGRRCRSPGGCAAGPQVVPDFRPAARRADAVPGGQVDSLTMPPKNVPRFCPGEKLALDTQAVVTGTRASTLKDQVGMRTSSAGTGKGRRPRAVSRTLVRRCARRRQTRWDGSRGHLAQRAPNGPPARAKQRFGLMTRSKTAAAPRPVDP